MKSYTQPRESREIVGHVDGIDSVRIFTSILIFFIIITASVAIIALIYDGIIANSAKTGNFSKITHHQAATAEILTVIAGILLIVTLIGCIVFVASAGFSRFRHHPHGYTLDEHHQMIDAYGEVKSMPTKDQIDISPKEMNRRENAAILEWGGEINNKELDLSEYKAGITDINTGSGNVYLSKQGIESSSGDSVIISRNEQFKSILDYISQ